MNTASRGGPVVRTTLAGLVALALAAPGPVLAEPAREPTAMSIGTPPAAEMGQRITLQALLVDSYGDPIPKAAILFTSPSSFLNVKGDAVLARTATNKDGLAVATVEMRSQGTVTIRAEFPGSERYEPSRASGQMAVGETAQPLYTQQAGVRIPGLNSPPPIGPVMLLGETPPYGLPREMAAIWPNISGWPIPAALLVVWSLYGFVVTLIFRMAAAGNDGGTAGETVDTQDPSAGSEEGEARRQPPTP